ncbi:MAG: CBS domain-containing protein [Oceanicaulis sp.]|mgnify:FL=1|jgi:CBS domain-containing protein|uniref:CBS domain-containing protein n=1 Tax=Oceanicaulis TaxID=153232 RepID=UPI0003B5017B|nr:MULTISPECIES: CBS domain-containing protein [Oceanicaulis]MAP48265.1 CBS domain-containing protein [Oceanicaulis sp.]MBL4539864.1 CBS domain-containing protein [Oceanicaulis sp.]|tara:strand:- start:408 stop:839 length:432 start_codon:yes stop_codon:yes gene_type:complete
MTAARILDDKGATVFTVRPTQSLQEAAAALTQYKVGAVIVTGADQEPVGVFSERDLARAVAQSGASALIEPVSSVMSTGLITAGPSDTVDTLLSLMTEKRVRHIIIMQGSDMQGVVSIGDVVKRKIAQTEAEAESLKAYIEGA